MWDVKYRPLRFSDVLGQEGAVRVLKGRLEKGTGLDISYLFSGGHGRGKTTLARILARALLCQNLRDDYEPCNECDNCKDILEEASAAFVEQDAASKGTIENIRAIVEDLPFKIPGAAKRIYLFDEAHRMGTGAQDVLLKPVEDKKMVAIFCTTEPEKIKGPIRSRCEEHAIRSITREDILKRMVWVLGQEGVAYEEDAVLTVIDYSHGHVRDILNRLEMVAQSGDVSMGAVREYLRLSVVSTFYDILLNLGNPRVSIELVEQACDQVGAADVAAGLAEAAMNSFRLANNMFADFALVDRERAQKVYEQFKDQTLQVAGYFLQSYKPTKVGLVCDVARFAAGGPQPLARAAKTPPVLVQSVAAVPAVPVAATTATSASTAVPEEASSAELEPAPEEPAPEAEAKPAEAKDPKLRDDGVGSLGSTDARALTDLDHKVIPRDLPRGNGPRTKTPATFQGTKGRVRQDYLPPEEWQREFAETYMRGRGA